LLEQFWNHGVRDFDIIGLSYYTQYHPVSIAYTGGLVNYLREQYPGKKVMVVETAYPWTLAGEDNAVNLISIPYSGYPFSPAGQKQWMVDLTQAVIDNGGAGVVYWEPAWVSTHCWTQWAQGSHWENCTFFDFNNELLEDGGIGWMMHPYDFNTSLQDYSKNHEQQFVIAPAPGGIRVSWDPNSMTQGNMQIRLSGMLGEWITEEQTSTVIHDGEMMLDIPPLSFGMYVVTISTPGYLYANKIILGK
jgi:arabinogalactan endo-1,4-beta-galactosidase